MTHPAPRPANLIADLRTLNRSIEEDRYGSITSGRVVYFSRTDWLRGNAPETRMAERSDDFSTVLCQAFIACARILRAVWQHVHRAELVVSEEIVATPPQAAAVANSAPRDTHQTDVKRNLVATMMLGQMYGQQAEVDIVFAAMSQAMGDARELRISLAFASSMAGDNELAQGLVDGGFDDWPHPELSMLSTALALKVGRDPRWIDIVNRVHATSGDQDVRMFATRLLETH